MLANSNVADSSEQIDSILCAAIELATPKERADYMRSACGSDQRLLHRLERLIDAHFRAGDFLEAAPIELKGDAAGELFEQPGSTIGSYKLLQQIGEGGMGVVFMAEQDKPVRRTVAIKIIKPGMDSRKVVTRFEAERQALALMDHPNIAKVFDAGTTETGRPYFVMELVKGVPIIEYCDVHQLNIEQRLDLFSEVCQAVQHAHQKGIIHRDIKPSNVLVAEYDDQPVPKVIDFGVAKAISQQLTEKTLFTEFGQIIGTFEYMSPEQAKFNQLDVDTRSDIYSLGVLLYELLVGSTPLDRDRLRSAAFEEVLRLIGEEEPPTPSTRLSSSLTLAAISTKRRTEPEKLAKQVRGDLDWIVMKCLEKERSRRYESASALAHDIRRYLDNEPIEARPPSTFYRLRKLVRRNKAGALATLAILAALVSGCVLSTWFYLNERQARLDAELATAREKQMRMEFEATAIIEQGRFLFRNRSWKASENELARVTQILAQLTGSHAATINTRMGGLRAQQGKWKESASFYAKALECCPKMFETYHWYLPVLLRIDDLETYRQVRKQAYQRFSETPNLLFAERLVKDCLVIPWEGADLEHFTQLTKRSLEAEPDHWAYGYFLFADGLVEYRRNHFREAIDRMEQTLARGNEDRNRNVQAYMVLSMAHYRLNDHDKAAQILAIGSEFAKEHMPCEDCLIDYQGWNDWVIAYKLMDEAKALVNSADGSVANSDQ